jgi:hypothetical protein
MSPERSEEKTPRADKKLFNVFFFSRNFCKLIHDRPRCTTVIDQLSIDFHYFTTAGKATPAQIKF